MKPQSHFDGWALDFAQFAQRLPKGAATAPMRGALEEAIARSPGDATDAQLIGLLRMGSAYALSICRASAAHDSARPGHLMGVALAGGAGDWHVLAQQLARLHLRGAAVEAIGVHGEPKAVPVLIDLLEQGDSLAEIVWALETITGVRHEPHATTWRAWWSSNEWRLPLGIRHRHGRPFSLLQCIDELATEAASSFGRGLAELEIRSGQRYPSSLDETGQHRRAALSEWRRWWAIAQSQFRLGSWTFQGKAVPP
jgi:hypothetical protein